MNKVFLAVLTLALMGAGCAQAPLANTNAAVPPVGRLEAETEEANTNTNDNTNTNTPVSSGNVNVNAEVDAILKDADDEQTSESSGDESDLTTAETLDLNSMIGASGNY